MLVLLASLVLGMPGGTMAPAAYCVNSDVPDTKAPGGFAPSKNNSWSMADVNVKADKLTLTVKKNVCCAMKGGECPLILVLANGTKEPVQLQASDSRLELGREAKDRSGNWRPIEFRAPSDCGNSRHQVVLSADRVWVWDVPSWNGSFATKCRYVLSGLDKPVVSEEFDAKIDPQSFELPAEWQKYGLLPDGRLQIKG